MPNNYNLFEGDNYEYNGVLSHSELNAIVSDSAGSNVSSLRDVFLTHANEYGIDDIDLLFPEATSVNATPDFIKRRTGWVSEVLASVYKRPFSRIKSLHADITADEARAKGYGVKGKLKKEEVIKMLKRVTTPTTIYKKQKLDRDDILDITDFDVVVWLKAEMRLMLEEELCRTILIGDGRDVDSDDKIKEEHVRPIYTDSEVYSIHTTMPANTKVTEQIDYIKKAHKHYKGSGAPVFYASQDVITDMLLLKDQDGRYLYSTEAELAKVLGVSKIMQVTPMENISRDVTNTEGVTETRDLIGIIVNLADYTVGADKGGATNFFDNFDIDYNAFKYLYETRCSGALTVPSSALVFEKVKPATDGAAG